jgi:hypothetical protein
MPINENYARHLPHQVPAGFPIFLTWNLKGAMPPAAIEKLRQRRLRLEKQKPRPGETISERRIRENKIIFAVADRFLYQAVDGPTHLKDPRAARCVEDSIIFGSGSRYDLFAWCVMSNHVHVLLTPRWKLRDVTKGIKGYTTHQINRLQDARGVSSGRTSRMTTGPATKRKCCESSSTRNATQSRLTSVSDPRSGRGRPRVVDRTGHRGKRLSTSSALAAA